MLGGVPSHLKRKFTSHCSTLPFIGVLCQGFRGGTKSSKIPLRKDHPPLFENVPVAQFSMSCSSSLWELGQVPRVRIRLADRSRYAALSPEMYSDVREARLIRRVP